jgi:hypothetical protein
MGSFHLATSRIFEFSRYNNSFFYPSWLPKMWLVQGWEINDSRGRLEVITYFNSKRPPESSVSWPWISGISGGQNVKKIYRGQASIWKSFHIINQVAFWAAWSFIFKACQTLETSISRTDPMHIMGLNSENDFRGPVEPFNPPDTSLSRPRISSIFGSQVDSKWVLTNRRHPESSLSRTWTSRI